MSTGTDSPTDRTLFGKGDYVYIKTKSPVTIGEKFYIINVVEKVKHPESGKTLGYLIEITGIAEVVENNDDQKVFISDSFDDISTGALLDTYNEITGHERIYCCYAAASYN